MADPVEEVRNPEIEKLVEQLPAAVDPDAPVEGMDLSSKLILSQKLRSADLACSNINLISCTRSTC